MAQMRKLLSPTLIAGLPLRNRVVIPPMVLFGNAGDDGFVTEAHVAHYDRLSKGGAGLLILEATCVAKEGRLSPDQLGIWEDGQISGLRKITDAVHKNGSKIFIQLHHAGIMSAVGRRVCPSDYVYVEQNKEGQRLAMEVDTIRGEALTLNEIGALRQAFVHAGRRAFEAGFDGVELHGCHGYLLCQFMNPVVNTREDVYGQDRTLLVREIMAGIRQETAPEFVIGIRLGGFEPDVTTALENAKALEAAGIQFLDISYGFQGIMDTAAEGDEALPAISRAAGMIRKAVSVPVFTVGHIDDPQLAERILTELDVDMIAVGRSSLVDPNWTNHVALGETPGACRFCKSCQWRMDPDKCAGRIIMERNK